MKTNGLIGELLGTECYNDIEYGHRVIWPLLDYLCIPPHARRPQFQIENPFGSGLLRLDYLIHHGDLPLVTIEGEPMAQQFDIGFKQAKNYSRNFKPRQRGCPMQERTVPFLLTAAGSRAEMCRAVVRGLNVEYVPIRESGRPAFLEWSELVDEAERMQPGASVAREQQVLVADAASQFFHDLYATIDEVPTLHDKDDRKIILFNDIIEYARHGDKERIEDACARSGMGAGATRKVLRIIALYKQKIDSDELDGAAVARGYRTFLLQPGGRGTHHYFTGESQSRPYIFRGTIRYRNVARYFTPTEIIQQMVRLAKPRAGERVIDLACGSGGFLAECLDYVTQHESEAHGRRFVSERLVGIDDDPFCVSCSRALLAFFYPGLSGRFQVFLHNSLYERAPRNSEIGEDTNAEAHLGPGSYDLVIGNPPGNDEYSGTNRAFITREWKRRFGHVSGGLMDHHCFVRRAVELAKPNGGRICLLVPKGLLTRDNRGMPALREGLAADCQLRAVISLPRVFKNNNARMAVVYLARGHPAGHAEKVVLAEIREKWRNAQGVEKATDLFGELEAVVDQLI